MLETITLGGGCFWCIEAIMVRLRGVSHVVSGYAGGAVENPTYTQVCSGTTGHAEVVQVVFDPRIISLHDILTIFFTLHDPTTMNRQGADVGTQYRSAVFTSSPEQEPVVRQVMEEIKQAKIWEGELVTTVEPLEAFYPAEEYHQNYYQANSSQPYCQIVIAPKVLKLRQQFAHLLQKEG